MSAPLPPQELDPYTDEKKATPVSAGPPCYDAAGYESSSPPPRTESEQRSRCRRRYRRFGHFVVALLLLWFAARYLVRHFGISGLGAHRSVWDLPAEDCGEHGGHPKGPHHRHRHRRPDVDVCVDSADWSDYEPDQGHHPRHLDTWRKTELSLPSTADDIFLVSRGFNTIGVLHITEAADREDIGVEVIVGFHENSNSFDKMRLCTLRRGDKGHGVGILIPPFRHHFRRRGSLFVNITVSLPEGKDVTTIPHFRTHLPMFGHVIRKLPTHKFDSVSFNSVRSPIYVEDLVGDKIRIHSKGGPIQGTFNTTSSLDIKTSNSPVAVTVNAFNEDNAVPTKVHIKSNNGPVAAELALISTHKNQTSGFFVVRTHTSNAPLAVNFTAQPPDAVLKLQAHTSNSPAQVHLDPSFEGDFKLRTSVSPAVVGVDDNVEDPAGRGRKRVVDVKTVGRFARVVHGDVAWVPQDKELAPAGKVEVSTSHSPLRLLL